jgi:hypothetical protein
MAVRFNPVLERSEKGVRFDLAPSLKIERLLVADFGQMGEDFAHGAPSYPKTGTLARYPPLFPVTGREIEAQRKRFASPPGMLSSDVRSPLAPGDDSDRSS